MEILSGCIKMYRVKKILSGKNAIYRETVSLTSVTVPVTPSSRNLFMIVKEAGGKTWQKPPVGSGQGPEGHGG
jgi:hypothetical protein